MNLFRRWMMLVTVVAALGAINGQSETTAKGDDAAKRANRENFTAALKAGDLDRLESILRLSPEVTTVPDAAGLLPLHEAVKVDRPDVIRILSKFGADLDSNPQGATLATPLTLAVDAGNYRVVECLLELGANPNLSFGRGLTVPPLDNPHTPVARAIALGRFDLVRLLAQYNGRVDMLDVKAAKKEGRSQLPDDLRMLASKSSFQIGRAHV